MVKSKNLIPVALSLMAISLILPWHYAEMSDQKVTTGAFVGDVTDAVAYLIILTPALFAAILGTALSRKRYARWLGITVTVFTIISGLFVGLMLFGEKFGELNFHIGGYIGVIGVLTMLVAGLMGTIKPEPRMA